MISRMLLREIEVAFSKYSQPVWFRIVKWITIVLGVYLFHDHHLFVFALLVLLILSVAIHLLWRHKTKGWTQSWIGWEYEKNKPKESDPV